jgi:hypothetical protein
MDYHVQVGLTLREGLSGPHWKFTKEELKQRITECWEKITLAT